MKTSFNIWGIDEFEGDGASCPVTPANLPWYKKLLLALFRFGVCPLCITMSISYSLRQLLKKRLRS